MPLWYKINPELNMILYIGEGLLRPADFFALEKTAFLSQPRKPGMITLVDLLEASTYFDLADIRHFIDNIKSMAKSGMKPGPYIMITNDSGLHLLAQAADLMAGKVDLKARMYYTLQDAIAALGLVEHESDIIQLWNECGIASSRTGCHLANIKTMDPAA